jgi:hypothetical protein
MRRISIALALFTLIFISISSAQQSSTTTVPNLIRYSGTLKDAQGAPLSSAPVGVTFAIYKLQEGGAPVWMETQNVTPDANGQYSMLLGSATATGLPSDLFSQQEQRWLGVQVQGQAEQARVLLVSVPYAFKAHEAETLGGLPASAFVQAAPTDTPSDGSNGTALNALSDAGSAGGTSRARGKTASGKPNTFAPCATIGGSGTLNFIPLWTPDGCTLGSSLMSQFTAGRVDVNGNFNLASTTSAYQIGASNVLSIGSSADDNLFVGLGAGTHNVTGSGQYNVFSGYQAGYSNTSGTRNTFVGYEAGFRNTTGPNNTFTGEHAGLNNTTGQANTFFGTWAGFRNTTGQANAFFGFQAGYSNTTGRGNVFSGYNAGYSNTTSWGNVFSGYEAGYSNTTGDDNVFSGDKAGYSNTTGDGNIFLGSRAGYSNTTGEANIFSGGGAGLQNTSGSYNTFSGGEAGLGNTTGGENTFTGHDAGYSNDTGSRNSFYGASAGWEGSGSSNTYVGFAAGYYSWGSSNIAVGYGAGVGNGPGSNDIYIGGRPDSGTESNIIRIGTQGTGDYQQNITYIAGIYGSTSSSGIPVYVNADGKLGTQTSSLRFKEQVRDMGDSTSALMKLRPVTFLYKPEYDKGERTLQYGLIAEEVAKVYPDMVAYEKDGQPYTVKYQYLAPMLLNEVQKQHAIVAAQQGVIKTQQERANAQQQQMQAQQQQIEQLQQRLSRLEAIIEQQPARN